MSDSASAESEVAAQSGEGTDSAYSVHRDQPPPSSPEGNWQELIDGIFNVPNTYRMLIEDSELEGPRVFLVQRWTEPISSVQAMKRLTNPDNHGYPSKEYELPKAMIDAFNAAVANGSKRLSEVVEKAIANSFYLEKLRKAEIKGEIPHYLKLRPREILYLPEENSGALNQEFRNRADEASKHMLDSLIRARQEYQVSLFQKTGRLRETVESIVLKHWLKAPNQSNSWDQTMPVNILMIDGEGNRISEAVPFSSIFFRAVMDQCRMHIGTVIENTYEKLSSKGNLAKKASEKMDAVIAEASSRPLQEALETRTKNIKRRYGDEEEDDPEGNEKAPQAAGAAGALPEPADRTPKKHHRGQPSKTYHRGGHSNTAAPRYNTAMGGTKGDLRITVNSGRGRASTPSHPPYDSTPMRGRGQGGRGRHQHWKTRGSHRGSREGWTSN